MKDTIQIGMLGCGTVGQGVLKIIATNAASIEARLGARLEVKSVVVRDPKKIRDAVTGFDPAFLASRLTSASALLGDPDIDIVVEAMGGITPAFDYVKSALSAGKSVVTANKALVAEHGRELLSLARDHGVDLYFEAAVAGGVPIIRVLREALASDRVQGLYGIINGTSNYILSQMTEEGLSFGEALSMAQNAGYAEADPTLDVGGGDAAHKLTILATLAFGVPFSPSDVSVSGITQVQATDIRFAARFGYVIKPLAVGRFVGNGVVELRVHPALVPVKSVLASISGALNAVYIEGAMLGPCLLSGYGAGALPTATSVVSDIIDVGRNILVGAGGRLSQQAFLHAGDGASPIKVCDIEDTENRYYLRFNVLDKPGVMAKIAGVLGAFEVSIEQMVQEGRGRPGDTMQSPVSMVMLTHVARYSKILASIKEIQALSFVIEPPCAIPVMT